MKQEYYLTAFLIQVFLLGGVLLPETGLKMFNSGNTQLVALSTLFLLALLCITLYQLSKTKF